MKKHIYDAAIIGGGHNGLTTAGYLAKAGLKVVAAKMAHLSTEQAEGFYAVHKERPFFNDLVKFMTSGPVMIQVLIKL